MADQKSERGGIFGAIGQFAAVIAIILLTKTVAAEAYYVPSGSMLPEPADRGSTPRHQVSVRLQPLFAAGSAGAGLD